VDTINEQLYKLFMEELHELELGHTFNYKRLAYMRSIISVLLYVRYAVLTNDEVIRILESYEQL
jgi:hypothetical protein